MQNLVLHIPAKLIVFKVDCPTFILWHYKLQRVPVHIDIIEISLRIFSLVHVQFYITSLGHVNAISKYNAQR